jgi:hypothetical protein
LGSYTVCQTTTEWGQEQPLNKYLILLNKILSKYSDVITEHSNPWIEEIMNENPAKNQTSAFLGVVTMAPPPSMINANLFETMAAAHYGIEGNSAIGFLLLGFLIEQSRSNNSLFLILVKSPRSY